MAGEHIKQCPWYGGCPEACLGGDDWKPQEGFMVLDNGCILCLDWDVDFLPKCISCSKRFTATELLLDGVEPDVHSPKCKWCIIKEAQDKFGVNNVILGNEN